MLAAAALRSGIDGLSAPMQAKEEAVPARSGFIWRKPRRPLRTRGPRLRNLGGSVRQPYRSVTMSTGLMFSVKEGLVRYAGIPKLPVLAFWSSYAGPSGRAHWTSFVRLELYLFARAVGPGRRLLSGVRSPLDFRKPLYIWFCRRTYLNVIK